MITVDTKNTYNALLKRAGDMSKAVNRALKVNAMQMADEIKQSIGAHKSIGRTYYRGGGRTGRKPGVFRGVAHKASKPYYPPNGDLGYLALSTTVSRKIENNTIFVIVGATYAKYLERGTKNPDGTVRMLPRPFVKPVRDRLFLTMKYRIQEAISNAT